MVLSKPELVLGPILRYVDDTSATVWVQTDRPCVVEVLGARSATFSAHGFHYAFVDIKGLAPASTTAYSVSLDGQLVWPPAHDLPPSVICTLDPDVPVRIATGSCRGTQPHDQRALSIYGADALRAYASTLLQQDASWPTLLLLGGDQIYADEPPELMREFLRTRDRKPDWPANELCDFPEYAKLYQLAWSDPLVRWLLSTVPSAMIFDDHDIRDDWNTSAAWRQHIQQQSWWSDRISAGLASYWIYQHLGNLSPIERSADQLYRQIIDSTADIGPIIDDFALAIDAGVISYQWSYHRDFGRVRLIVLDTRCARTLTPKRDILGEKQWVWFNSLAVGDVDHLLISSTLPVLLPTSLHYIEQWNEAICGGAWGSWFAKLGERIRQGLDLEHWAAFRDSFKKLTRVISEIASGQRGPAPRTIQFLSGDIHYSYVAQARLARRGLKRLSPMRKSISSIYQVVCSPIRNPLGPWLRRANMLAASSRLGVGIVGRLFARLAGVKHAGWRWSPQLGPWFDNTLVVLELAGDKSSLTWHRASSQEPSTFQSQQHSMSE